MMKRTTILGAMVAVLAGAAVVGAQEAAEAPHMPEMPAPTKEHAWLQQLVGEWETKGEVDMGPGAEPMKSTGTEKAEALGDFWILSRGTGTMGGMEMTGVMTLGYDPEKEKFVGTWVDSMTSHLWEYEGTLDETGTILTLESEGPCPMRQGQMTKFRDVVEVKNKDHKVMKSYMQDENGEWTQMLTVNARRKA